MNFGVYGASELRWANAGALAGGTWTFVVGVFDGSALHIYRDGLLVETDAIAGPIRTRPAEVVLGGRDAPTGYADWWSGAIDEVRLWDRALSAEEIAQIYDGER